MGQKIHSDLYTLSEANTRLQQSDIALIRDQFVVSRTEETIKRTKTLNVHMSL